ncbi:hypothetical protein BAUCODRAFT_36667 [Baudoinia panamericana UAMH 10762]|uniref:Major facilitator superfamily (MFS) profile domain-containing protein n=1 Tax=Baudoinia panamericana (strain UAMH 10762) TaxID=717646 RepID=M2MCE3_BAUPA|nr:uncharacterized protein BAUCODRAFT_36667 [Baudoinia panamericana UAMH 10762]EMC94196.1 hypothetical protein BAUCODRAFT_36667 [Baudoinia panamericana UAMH 10762]
MRNPFSKPKADKQAEEPVPTAPVVEATVAVTDTSTGKPEDVTTTKSNSLASSGSDVAKSELEDGSVGAEKVAAHGPPGEQPEGDFPPFRQQLLIMSALLMSVFLIAIDQTIVATAIPRMTDEFHSLDDVGWYGSAFMLTASCFQLLFGRIYTFYTPKYVFMLLILVFEIGSAICGAAPNSTTFIVGRAVAGTGVAGIMNGAIILMLSTLPLAKRPMWMGLFGAVFGVASVVGPLVGGAFTTDVTWRWCFYINLPIGAVAIVVVLFLIKPSPAVQSGLSIRQQLAKLDIVGQICLLPCIVCLLIALQWGGSVYEYSNWRMIILYLFFGLLLVGFVLVQIFMQNVATIPARVIRNRSMIFGMLHTFCVSACMLSLTYFLPIWFQAIKGTSAVRSGIDTIPLVLSLVVGNIMAGQIVGRIGYYTAMAWASAVVVPIGAGLLNTLNVNTRSPTWIGYQILVGFGIGLGMQQGTMAAQTVLPPKDVPLGVSLMMFMRQFSGAIFVSVSQNVFDTQLVSQLTKFDTGLSSQEIINTGATNIRGVVPAAQLPELLQVYNLAIRKVFQVALIVACISVIGALGMEWKSLKDKNALGAGGDGKKTTSKPSTPDEKV